ncbi:tryptophanyl-tRNA synthetase [Intrasporangium oryzae NRRL B-24470]|uniref:Tryptophan--tRNA ligase n=1 Tax=Intrasporangium oryzae NRRL B-24470 TaxID=1386089 RepID=W9GEM1_9MICO|nr:tryptophan--tRNA ligase [Intrasporangium oryzae]EWT03667.1 tryptophanyl-tRNA synthetase [Intrasporangium oryzae NRRL B-24470]
MTTHTLSTQTQPTQALPTPPDLSDAEPLPVHVDESTTYAAARDRSAVLDGLIDGHAASDPTRFRMLTGDRPTGPLHIGHYLASLRNRVRLQDKGVETFVVIADYQVITDRDSVGAVGDNVRGLVLDYLAAGIDPERTTIFTHSAVPALNQLMLPFLSLVTDAELRRNPTVKDELGATGARPLTGLLLTYPVHQAADILFCHARIVPVGRDQLPHLEQTRAIARRFNSRYAAGQSVFAEPEALLSDVPLLLGLDGAKMSKSRGNVINLSDTADETASRIRSARTDSERSITFEPERRPEIANLLTLAGLLRDEDPVAIADSIGDRGARALKDVVTEAVNETLADHRARRADLARDPAYVTRVLHEGNARANAVAERSLATVRAVMGMAY